jgi:beta-lactamase class C
MRLLLPALLLPLVAGAATAGDRTAAVKGLVEREAQAILPADGIGGAAMAVRIDGRTMFFNYGWADTAGKQPITSDSLFNIASLRKLFEATLIAHAVQKGELALDDPVASHVGELAQGGTIRRVTIGQLATYTSGLLLRQDYEPWPDWGYTLPEFIGTLNAWKPERDLEPGQEHIYTHAGYVLLQLVLERRFGQPIGELMEQRLLVPLGLTATVLPLRGEDGRARLEPALMRRAVNGYGQDGAPIGAPGDQQGYYHFPGTGQMFSSARDLATFLAAHLGDAPEHAQWLPAMQFTQRPVVPYGPRSWQALAWEVNYETDPPIVEKIAGLNNTSGYIGMIPAKKLGIVILANRGSQPANAVGRRVLAELARR